MPEYDRAHVGERKFRRRSKVTATMMNKPTKGALPERRGSRQSPHGNNFGVEELLAKTKISLYKNSDLRYKRPRPVPLRRGVARRHETLGAGCDGRGSAFGGFGRRARRWFADGEVVWFWRRDRGVTPRRSKAGAATVTTNAAHREEHEVSRRPLRGESRAVLAVLVV
jgi:hypothetical protein